MIKNKKIPSQIILAVFSLVAIMLVLPQIAVAQTPPECQDSGSARAIEECANRYTEDRIVEECGSPGSNPRQVDARAQCEQRVRDQIADGNFNGGVNRPGLGNFEADCEEIPLNKNNCGIIAYLQLFINVLSAIVGIVIAIMFAVRGMQYMTARDNAQQVTQAKMQFFWLIIALVTYIFTFSLLQWLVPGGGF